MSANCSASTSRPRGLRVYWESWPRGTGGGAGREDGCGRQVARMQVVGGEPHAHAVVLLAEDGHVADALHPGHGVFELDRGEIAQVERIIIRPAGLRIVLGIETDPQQDVRGTFLDDDADGANHVGERRLGDGYS